MRMYIKSKHGYTEWLLMLLLLVFVYDAEAAQPPPTLAQCNQAMDVGVGQPLNFGDYDGTTAGNIIIGTSGGRTTTGPILTGGTVQVGVYTVSSKKKGCDIYSVNITYLGNPTLTGTGAAMPIITFESDPLSGFNISPNKNVPTTVNIGATLESPASQTEGPYTGTYQISFNFQ